MHAKIRLFQAELQRAMNGSNFIILDEVSWKLEDKRDPHLDNIEEGIKMIQKIVEISEKKVLEGKEILSKKILPARRRTSDTTHLIGSQQQYSRRDRQHRKAGGISNCAFVVSL